jgi:hypothetical protein
VPDFASKAWIPDIDSTCCQQAATDPRTKGDHQCAGKSLRGTYLSFRKCSAIRIVFDDDVA